MYKLIRKLLFLLYPESAHTFVLALLKIPLFSKLLEWIYHYEHPSLALKVFGLQFRNPVGLAAGFDKDAKGIDQFADLGFGFIEIGTVTPEPQPGNPRPRLFRLLKDQALINRMGFNNDGAAVIAKRLKKRNSKIIIGGNIGKNKATPNEGAFRDYVKCFLALRDAVDYFVINVSSPNTPGLRELQEREPLTKILLHIKRLNNDEAPKSKPILLKIAPDLSDSQMDDIIEIVKQTGIDGVIATNTTVSRENLNTPLGRLSKIGNGGLSGKPLAKRSTEVIRYLHEKSGGAFPIIAVGGILSAKDALEKLNAGASLIQLYTGFIYEGPGLIKKIKKELANSHEPPKGSRPPEG